MRHDCGRGPLRISAARPIPHGIVRAGQVDLADARAGELAQPLLVVTGD